MGIIKKIKEFVLDCLFPPLCLSCHKNIKNQSNYLCDNCFSEINFYDGMFCPKCGQRAIDEKLSCYCLEEYILAPACHFEIPIIPLLYGLKYLKLQKVHIFLSALIIFYFQKINFYPKDYLITYIPIHKIKQRKRGFNQSKLIAQTIGEKFSLEIISMLIKNKNNQPQAKIKDPQKRIQNAKDSFSLKKDIHIENKKIIIIDDVSTTGATLKQATHLLKTLGAKKIIAVVVANAKK